MGSKFANVRRLLLGLGLIAAAAAVLLSTDLRSRRGARDEARARAAGSGGTGVADGEPRHLAILQHSSSQVMDDVREGLLAGLASKGWVAGPKLVVDVYNAHADLPTGNAIATKLASGDYDVVATISTPMLQAFANANRDGRKKHVFAGVTAPVESGVGIRSLDSTDKPAWMTGIGSAQPVAAIFDEVKRLQPSLQTVGVAWNPAEVNSEICTRRAREASKTLGMTLIEAPIESAKDVPEAAGSLVVRGAQAIWTGGDATIVPAIDALVAVANKAGIPVFSNMAGQVEHGTTFDLGANYQEVGAEAGRLIARVLEGEDPAGIPVRNYMPERLLLNEKASAALRDPIAFDDRTRAEADGIVGPDGTLTMRSKPPTATPVATAPAAAAPDRMAGSSERVADPNAAAARGGPLGGKRRNVSAIVYLETPTMEEGLAGVKLGLAEAGLVEGRDFDLRVQSAQGDVAILNGIVDATVAAAPDAIVALSTPALQAVANKVKGIPVVFAIVSNPFIAGAGKTDADHLPNVTGVYISGPFDRMAQLIHDQFPAWKRVGTLFCPAEVNSVFVEGKFRAELARRGIELDSVAAATPADLPDAASALASRPIDAIVQLSDNQGTAGFPAIARAAKRGGKPLVGFNSQSVEQGAAFALVEEYRDAGRGSGSMVARILRGASPARIPFHDFEDAFLVVDEANARALGFELPPSLLAAAAAEAKARASAEVDATPPPSAPHAPGRTGAARHGEAVHAGPHASTGGH